MKIIFPTIHIILFILLFFSATNLSQTEKAEKKSTKTPTTSQKSTEEPSAQKKTEPMREGERLTFMQKDKVMARSQPESGSLLLKTLGAMFLIVGLVFFGAWSLKKLGFGNNSASATDSSPELVILSNVSPKNGQTISVVKFGERTLLVGSTAQSFTLLAEEQMTTQEEFEPNDFTSQPRSVAELLAEENISFDLELEKATKKLNIFGGQS